MHRSVKLLVSVRSSKEALAAFEGGADIIDVKDPSNGSLGLAQSCVIEQITDLIHARSPNMMISAALGEVSESTVSNAVNLSAVSHLTLVKSGLSGLLSLPTPWQKAWHRFREMTSLRHSKTQWVAVAYADERRSDSPSVMDVLEEGHRIGCPFLLIDTFQKDGTSLLDWVSQRNLDRIRRRTRDLGMKLALAGQITTGLLPQVLCCDPDIVAVRGSVCADGHRGKTVTRSRVRSFAAILGQQQRQWQRMES
ncbi:MAG: (5-formylfuran-3-yl)methyl phosphate synthase [Fuerstiella sp.]|nr:(5-formylfuran-3-yl)methyl phosphate synthase [Fuerstiella sp.]